MIKAAPLFSLPGAQPLTGGAAEWFEGSGGVRLRAALFAPSLALGLHRGSVVVSPGRTEPIEKYLEVAHRLLDRGFVVLIHDWRGQGLSGGRPAADPSLGHARGYQAFVDDYGRLLNHFESRLPKPWLAMGHSMGGCLTLLALALGENRFDAAMLSAPMLGLRTGAIPRPLGRLLAGLLTAVGQGEAPARERQSAAATFEANILTHDAERYARNLALESAHPELAVGPPTWGWLDFAFSATATLQAGRAVGRPDIPVTVMAAEDERLVDNAAAARIVQRLPKGRFLMAPGAYHEILQELDAIQDGFWREFDDLAAMAAR